MQTKIIFDHHIVRKSQICCLNKLTSKELYLIFADPNLVELTAQDYLKNLFESSNFDWKKNFPICNTDTKTVKCSSIKFYIILYM